MRQYELKPYGIYTNQPRKRMIRSAADCNGDGINKYSLIRQVQIPSKIADLFSPYQRSES